MEDLTVLGHLCVHLGQSTFKHRNNDAYTDGYAGGYWKAMRMRLTSHSLLARLARNCVETCEIVKDHTYFLTK